MKKPDTALLSIVKALAKQGTDNDGLMGLEKCYLCDMEFFTVNGDNHRKSCPVGKARRFLSQRKKAGRK